MANALGDRSSTKILTAEQLGTPSNHIAIAYIDSIQPAPPFNEDLQATCNIGNTTTTPIICDSLTATANDITAAAGDIEATLGDITAGGEIVSVSGNIEAMAGNITALVGNIEATAGDITAVAGNIQATAGDITATLGNIVATSGGVTAAAGNSKFNRMEYSYYYGGSTYAAPIALTNVLPYVAFSIPPNIYTFVLFYTHALVGVSSFPFELHTSLTDVLKDYNIIVSSHTANNNGGQSLGYNNIVSGDSLSDPTNKSKITVIINTSGTYASQTLKCIVQLVYSPSP
jgi:hypothetical protein